VDIQVSPAIRELESKVLPVIVVIRQDPVTLDPVHLATPVIPVPALPVIVAIQEQVVTPQPPVTQALEYQVTRALEYQVTQDTPLSPVIQAIPLSPAIQEQVVTPLLLDIVVIQVGLVIAVFPATQDIHRPLVIAVPLVTPLFLVIPAIPV
jgi:hypothetical protein